jgi:transcriptional regulator with PAS, ATPase and Fis domain
MARRSPPTSLRPALERLIASAEGVLEELEGADRSGVPKVDVEKIASAILRAPGRFKATLEAIELAVMRRAIAREGSRNRAAQLLELDRKTFQRRWEKLAPKTRRK